MRKKTTWIVLGSTLLLLGLAVFSRPTTDAPTPEAANRAETGTEQFPSATISDATTADETTDPGSPSTTLPATPNPITAAIAKGPARFLMRGRNATTFFTPKGVTAALSNPDSSTRGHDPANSDDEEAESKSNDEPDGWAIHWELVGANEVEPEAKGELTGKVNYYTGDASVTGLSTYSYIEYENVYEGVDLLVESRNQGLKYTLEVAPEVDPNVIRLRYRGAESIRMTPDGKGLKIETGVGTVEENALYVYQNSPSGDRIQIPAQYSNISQAPGDLTWEYSIQIGNYDPTIPLVIDPTISWGTYIGGADGFSTLETAYGIAVSGTDIFVTGKTKASDFPTTAGVVQPTYSNSTSYDAFIAKLDSSGAVTWATYLGGVKDNIGQDIAVKSNGNPVAMGYTSNDGTLSSPLVAYGGGGTGGTYDTFVVELSGAAGTYTWGTYFGGDKSDYGHSIALDNSDNIYIAGETYSSSIPNVTGGNNGDRDVFVAKLNSSGAVQWGRIFGGSGTDYGTGVSVTGDGSLVGVTGHTASNTNFPVTTATSFAGGTYDIFVASYDITTPANDWVTFLGGTYSYDYGYACAFDGSNNLVVSCRAQKSGLSIPGLVEIGTPGSSDILLAKYGTSGTLAWATLLGGTSSDYGLDMALDSTDNIYLTGYTYSSNFPDNATTAGFQPSANSSAEAFVVKLNSAGTTLVWSSYFGGNMIDRGESIALDSLNNVYITGDTTSTDLVTGQNLGGSMDTFVAKVDTSGSPLTLTWATYLGGTKSNETTEWGASIDTDDAGNLYITGSTNATDFVPTGSAGPFTGAGSYGGSKTDAFVMKITSGLALDWVSYLGGSQPDYGEAIVVETGASPAVFVAGYTSSKGDFPISGSSTNGWQTSHSGDVDGFTTKINSSTGDLVWSYYIGGSKYDYIKAIALDSSGNLFVGGYTSSSNFPLNGTPIAGSYDLFVTKLLASDATPGWTAVHGGDQYDYLYDITVAGGNVYATGRTKSDDTSTPPFPLSSSSLWGGSSGIYDAFVAKIIWTGNTGNFSWVSYLGSNGNDHGHGIVADTSGNTYITGYTSSQNITAPINYGWGGGTYDAFLAKFDDTGAQTFFMYLGGNDYDYADGIDLYGGNIYIVGRTKSNDFPVNGGSAPMGYDAYVCKVDPASPSVTWTQFVGGAGTEYGNGVAVDSSGFIYLTGKTNSSNFLTNAQTTGFQTALAGSEDGFVAQLTDTGTSSPPVINLYSTTTPLVFTTSATQQVTLTNTGGTTLNWESDSNAGWLTVNPVSGTVTAPASTTLNITVDTSSLLTGNTYNGAISIFDPAFNISSSVSVTVDLTGNTPTISLTSDSLSFSAEEGTGNPPDQTVTITNSGSGSLDWERSLPIADWLTVTPTSGNITTGSSILTFNVDITGLTEGVYSDSININGSGATNSPWISVMLDISAPTTNPGPGSPPSPSNDGGKKNPLTCGGSAAEIPGNGLLPLALAFFGLLLVFAIRRKL